MYFREATEDDEEGYRCEACGFFAHAGYMSRGFESHEMLHLLQREVGETLWDWLEPPRAQRGEGERP